MLNWSGAIPPTNVGKGIFQIKPSGWMWRAKKFWRNLANRTSHSLYIYININIYHTGPPIHHHPKLHWLRIQPNKDLCQNFPCRYVNFTHSSRCWIAVCAAAKPPSRQIRHVAVEASVHKSRWLVWPMIAFGWTKRLGWVGGNVPGYWRLQQQYRNQYEPIVNNHSKSHCVRVFLRGRLATSSEWPTESWDNPIITD